MPPGRKPTRSQEEFVTEAIRFADEHGLADLTLRALGTAMGASTTAVYRYFTDKEALFSAMRDTLLAAALSGADLVTQPVDVLRSAAHAYRAVAREHPCLSQLMALSRLEGPTASSVPDLIAGALEGVGLGGPDLVLAYRQLETFVVGTCAFDFADAPRHLAERHARMIAVERPDFRAAFRTASDVERMNELAYSTSLDALLDSIVARAVETE